MQRYKVLMLGTPEAGKTVLMASMYQRLAVQSSDIGFSLSCNTEVQRATLNRIYREIINTSSEWPQKTRSSMVSEWHFTCNIQAKDLNNYPTLQFTYLDYAGEVLTDPKEGESSVSTIHEEIERADVLLAMLDGYEILKLMLNKENDDFIYLKLTPILQIVAQCHQPVHFVITKWDLLDGKFSLAQIRSRLLEIEVFHQTVLNRSEKYSTRLIPISSVGIGFAELQTQANDGIIMRKIPGAKPSPFQVEIPFACVLPDVLERQLRELEQRLGSKDPGLKNPRRAITLIKVAQHTLPALRKAAKVIASLARKRKDGNDKQSNSKRAQSKSSAKKSMLDIILELVTAELLDMLITYLEFLLQSSKEKAEEREQQLLEKRQETLKLVQDQKTASEYLIYCFLHLKEKLEQTFPESDLSTTTE